jgi:uncharacterized protein YkwD
MRRFSQQTQTGSFKLESMRFAPLILLTMFFLSACGSVPISPGTGTGPSTGNSNPAPGSTAPNNPGATTPTPTKPKPVNPPSVPNTPSAEARVALDLVNAARAQPRSCGGVSYPAVPALTWNSKLEAAARLHNQDMIAKQYFDHVSPDGSNPASRVMAQGYVYGLIGENIAVGSVGSSLSQVSGVVNSWLGSPGHCRNIMNANFTEMGLASTAGPMDQFDAVYWTQDFAKPR